MTKDELLNRIAEEQIIDVFHKKGYVYFPSGDYNLNIVGVRSDQDNKVTNKFDDFMFVFYRVGGELNKKLYNITTEPGLYYMQKELGNKKGTAILVPGQYRGCWQVGKHNGKYEALVQAKTVSVYRDGNKDLIYDMIPEKVDKGIFGINIHRSNPYTASTKIDNWSAGCQVFSSPKEFNEFMWLCNEQKRRYGNSFTYTLITEQDLLG